MLSPQLLDTVPQNSEAPSVDLLPPKSGEGRLWRRLGPGLGKAGSDADLWEPAKVIEPCEGLALAPLPDCHISSF